MVGRDWDTRLVELANCTEAELPTTIVQLFNEWDPREPPRLHQLVWVLTELPQTVESRVPILRALCEAGFIAVDQLVKCIFEHRGPTFWQRQTDMPYYVGAVADSAALGVLVKLPVADDLLLSVLRGSITRDILRSLIRHDRWRVLSTLLQQGRVSGLKLTRLFWKRGRWRPDLGRVLGKYSDGMLNVIWSILGRQLQPMPVV